tara:strand:+ start:285 stop:500 length:216 start_codon:yes stop_codon:yes gene_type:complete
MQFNERKKMKIQYKVSVGDIIPCYEYVNGFVDNKKPIKSKIMSINTEKREATMENGSVLCLKNVKIKGYDK